MTMQEHTGAYEYFYAVISLIVEIMWSHLIVVYIFVYTEILLRLFERKNKRLPYSDPRIDAVILPFYSSIYFKI